MFALSLEPTHAAVESAETLRSMKRALLQTPLAGAEALALCNAILALEAAIKSRLQPKTAG